MARTTKRGDELADRLLPFIGQTDRIREVCAQITADAAAYNRVQEKFCSDEMTPAQEEDLRLREETLERSIADQVGHLPNHDDGLWRVRFEGDPRGWTVRLLTPDEREIGCDV